MANLSPGRLRICIPRLGISAFVLCLASGQVVLLWITLRNGHCQGQANDSHPDAQIAAIETTLGGSGAQLKKADELSALHLRWDVWPYGDIGGDKPSITRVGIVTGGSSDLFGGGPGSYGDATSCLLLLLATRKGYALYVERAMQRYGTDLPVAWQKVRLLRNRFDDVDLLIWIDADVAWTAPHLDFVDFFFRNLSTSQACTGHLGQARWDNVAGKAIGELSKVSGQGSPALWASADVRSRQQKNMNLNSAVLAMQAGPSAAAAASRQFLDMVWSEGKDPWSFRRHNPGWRRQPPGHHYWGWPFEQGAVWAVLDSNHDLLRRTCIVEVGVLHSVQYKRWLPGSSPGAHMPGMSAKDRRKAACRHLAAAMVEPGSCSSALRQCPDLYGGRLLAIHVDGFCKHCLGQSGSAAADPNVSDWSFFDCECLQQPGTHAQA